MKTLVPIFGFLLIGACAMESVPGGGVDENEFTPIRHGDLVVEDVVLQGNIGEVAGFDRVSATEGWSSEGWASVFTLASAETGKGMTIVDFVGGIDSEEEVMVTGCSGEDPSDWAFDRMADEVLLRRSDGASGVTFDYDAVFEGYGDEETSVVTGSFTMVR